MPNICVHNLYAEQKKKVLVNILKTNTQGEPYFSQVTRQQHYACKTQQAGQLCLLPAQGELAKPPQKPWFDVRSLVERAFHQHPCFLVAVDFCMWIHMMVEKDKYHSHDLFYCYFHYTYRFLCNLNLYCLLFSTPNKCG